MIEIDRELYEAEPEVVDYINTLVRELREEREKNAKLEAENKLLEEKYQWATDTIVTVSFNLENMCKESQSCRECKYRVKDVLGKDRCPLEWMPAGVWSFGGAGNENN